MSVINKEPFIKKLLASCSSEELDTLSTLINGGGNQTPIKRTANPIDTPEIPHISVSDKGIHLCSLTINYTNFLGYLVYTDLFCALISFTDAQVLKIFDLTEDKARPNTVDEAINILELRSTLFEVAGGSGGSGGSGGGGSSGGGSADQDIELFDKVVLNINSNIFENRQTIDNNTRLIYGIRTSNSPDDIKKALKLLSNSSSRLNFVIADLEGAKKTIGSILKWTNYNDDKYEGMIGTNVYVTNIDENSLGEAIMNGSANYIEKAWFKFNDSSFYGFSLAMLPYAGKESEFSSELQSKITNYTVTLEVICPKDEITIQGGQGGGTVEAEPIVSIKMTNMDCTGNDGSETRIIRDLQFYCTKERWDNFVSLASSQFQVDITYANFDSVFKSLDVIHQSTALGYLLMDYYNGKVLPKAYLQNNQTVNSIAVKVKYGLIDLDTIIDPQSGIEFVWSASFRGSNTSSDVTVSEDGVIPAPDMAETNYYTANTVITVEEIEGASIGASGGSGTSDVLYKHTITGLVAEPDTSEAEPEAVTISFLSKYANSFASNSSLTDFGANMLNTGDANVFINPMVVGDSGGINVTVYPVVANGSLSQIRIFFPYSTSNNFYYHITASRNTSGITDTVEPYIQVSGGSGSSADTLKNYKELLTFYDQNGDKICGISKILSLKTKEWYYGVLDNGIQSAASMLGLTIPTVTDDNTTQSGINTILGAMQQAGVSSNIPQLILNFVTDFDFVIKESVSNNGTEVYPLFVTGDTSAYIMIAGSFTNLLTQFDFTGAYTVGYSLTEVNVTD